MFNTIMYPSQLEVHMADKINIVFAALPERAELGEHSSCLSFTLCHEKGKNMDS